MPLWTPQSATSRPSSLWSGPAKARARRSTLQCSRPPARLKFRADAFFPLSCPAKAGHPVNAVLHFRIGRARGNDGGALAMTIDNSLRDFTGTLVLVGAGKMGGAMLQGWLALGLDPQQIVIIEPNPSADIAALKARGVRINPTSVNDASVIVIAIK